MWNARFWLNLAVAIFMASTAQACLDDEFEHLTHTCKTEPEYHAFLNALFPDAVAPLKIAVISGVSDYPNLPSSQQLPYAAHDIEILKRIFADNLEFDEVIVVEGPAVNEANFRYLFENYIPERISRREGSSVVFAFSGHGADFGDAGYLFEYDTTSIEIESYEDARDAIRLETLKAFMSPTLQTSHHFLALINSCKGGHFLTSGGAAFGAAFHEKGSHGITAGGANEFVYARDNVGSGKGSVFFEMVDAAFSNVETRLGAQLVPPAAGNDGILSASELATFLGTTIRFIEEEKVEPRFERIRPAQAGQQGEIFFVVDEDEAANYFATRFPDQFKRAFGLVGEAINPNDNPETSLFGMASLLSPDSLDGERLKSQDWIALSMESDSTLKFEAIRGRISVKSWLM